MQMVNFDHFPFFFFKQRKKNPSVCKMTLLSTKPVSWSYSVTTLGTEMLSSVFSFYYVKLFLHVYKTSEVAFVQAQVSWRPLCPFPWGSVSLPHSCALLRFSKEPILHTAQRCVKIIHAQGPLCEGEERLEETVA